VAWAGNPAQEHDRNRSIPFGVLAPLFPRPNTAPQTGETSVEARVGASFVSIQRDLRGDEAAQLAAQPALTHIGGALADFADTAAVLALCDLLITVGTAP